MEETIEITRGSLIMALRQWEQEVKSAEWSQRDDDLRFADSADYLFGLMRTS